MGDNSEARPPRRSMSGILQYQGSSPPKVDGNTDWNQRRRRRCSAGSKVTVINTNELPNFSTERYFMLSEIQIKAHSVTFLSDFESEGDEITQESSSAESNRENDDDINSANTNVNTTIGVDDDANSVNSDDQESSNYYNSRSNGKLPEFVVLYLLWKPGSFHAEDPLMFIRDVIKPCIDEVHTIYRRQQKEEEAAKQAALDVDSEVVPTTQNSSVGYLSGGQDTSQSPEQFLRSMDENDERKNKISDKPRIYVVVDRLTRKGPSIDDGQSEEEKKEFEKKQIQCAEKLIRLAGYVPRHLDASPTSTSSSQDISELSLSLRDDIEGMTVGLSDDFRAAPGMETCMNAILVGGAERRQYPKESNSIDIKQSMRNLGNLATSAFIGNNDTKGSPATTPKSKMGSGTMKEDPARSSIGIVTEHPEDLTGLFEEGKAETDAVQGLTLHMRLEGFWGGTGYGDILNFAARAQKSWRAKWKFAEVIDEKDLKIDYWAVRDGSDLDAVGNSASGLMGRRANKKRAGESLILSSRKLRKDVDETSNLMINVFLTVFLAMFLRTNPRILEYIDTSFHKIIEIVKQVLES